MSFARIPPTECEKRNARRFNLRSLPSEIDVGETVRPEALVACALACRCKKPYAFSVSENGREHTLFLKRAKRGFVMIEAELDDRETPQSFWAQVAARVAESENDPDRVGPNRLAARLALGRHPWMGPCVRLLRQVAKPGVFLFIEVTSDAVAHMRAFSEKPAFESSNGSHETPWDDDLAIPFRFVFGGGAATWAWISPGFIPSSDDDLSQCVAFIYETKKPRVISARANWLGSVASDSSAE